MVERSGRAAYLQVADDLRDKIDAGDFAIGDAIPSTSELMRTYGASNTVVRKAVDILRAEDLVLGQPGKAVYVIGKPGEPAPTAAEIMEIIGGAIAKLEQLEARVVKLEKDR